MTSSLPPFAFVMRAAPPGLFTPTHVRETTSTSWPTANGPLSCWSCASGCGGCVCTAATTGCAATGRRTAAFAFPVTRTRTDAPPPPEVLRAAAVVVIGAGGFSSSSNRALLLTPPSLTGAFSSPVARSSCAIIVSKRRRRLVAGALQIGHSGFSSSARWMHSSQKQWLHGSDVGLVYTHRQMAHCSCAAKPSAAAASRRRLAAALLLLLPVLPHSAIVH